MKIQTWLKFFGVDMAKKRCNEPGAEAVKLTLSEEWTNVINWFGCTMPKTSLASLVMELRNLLNLKNQHIE